MGLLKHFRSANKLKENGAEKLNGKSNGDVFYPGAHAGRDYISRCPPKVLTKIFEYVCPHALDKTYEACEDTNLDDDGCPLCDMRDLSHCARTRRDWYRPATELLYVDRAHA